MIRDEGIQEVRDVYLKKYDKLRASINEMIFSRTEIAHAVKEVFKALDTIPDKQETFIWFLIKSKYRLKGG